MTQFTITGYFGTHEVEVEADSPEEAVRKGREQMVDDYVVNVREDVAPGVYIAIAPGGHHVVALDDNEQSVAAFTSADEHGGSLNAAWAAVKAEVTR